MKLGEPDYQFDYDEVSLIVGRMWRSAQPGPAFLNAWNAIACKGQRDYRNEIFITRRSGSCETERVAGDKRFFDWVKPRLERNFGFRSLVQRYAELGIKGQYMDFGEYSWHAYGWSFVIQPDHLPCLEHLAQTEAGFITEVSRATAAQDFRIYVQRHYDEHWEENRKRLPPIDKSPYDIWLP